ncbi:CdiA C-terminal domain-containing protein [Glycomyces dulcitolivorans]|uniref:CdiA C-terminal domain-containing protein n=1 Tax=Glycomyces dulcitolivorans TaxID=2200759 RepID=UPI000DD2E6A7|nr:hypothetical protein [Glycomyces dulcitolivorans]
MTSIDEAAGAVGGNAEHARDLASGITASKQILDDLTAALTALGLDKKSGRAGSMSTQAETLTAQALGLADALGELQTQIDSLRTLLAAASSTATARPDASSKSTSRPAVTRPKHAPDADRRPTGTPAVVDGSKTRGLQRENESAIALARAGYDVEQSPPTNTAGKNPDYRIQGELWDCYAPSGSSAKNIRKSLRNKVHDRQASRIVLNLDDCSASPAEIRTVLERDPIRGLEEIKIVRGGDVEQFYPWDSEVG